MEDNTDIIFKDLLDELKNSSIENIERIKICLINFLHFLKTNNCLPNCIDEFSCCNGSVYGNIIIKNSNNCDVRDVMSSFGFFNCIIGACKNNEKCPFYLTDNSTHSCNSCWKEVNVMRKCCFVKS